MKLLLTIALATLVSTLAAQQVRKIKATELSALIDSSTRPMIINFWATWCVPCIEEIPAFQKMAEKYRADSVQFLLVSLDMKDDYQDKISRFIIKRKINNPVVWLDEHDADYFCPLVDKKWSGSIPATLFVNRTKGYRHFIENKLSESRLEAEIRALIN